MSLEQTMHNIMEENTFLPTPDTKLTVTELSEVETNEVITFLSERPVHPQHTDGMNRTF